MRLAGLRERLCGRTIETALDVMRAASVKDSNPRGYVRRLSIARWTNRLSRMGREVKRQAHRDARGRVWEVALVPVEEAAKEDARFWWEELTAEERVDAVYTCLESALKARGIDHVPRLRRTARVLKRRQR